MRYSTFILVVLGIMNLAVGAWLPTVAHFRSAQIMMQISATYGHTGEGDPPTPSEDERALFRSVRELSAYRVLAPAMGTQGLALIVIAWLLERRAGRAESDVTPPGS